MVILLKIFIKYYTIIIFIIIIKMNNTDNSNTDKSNTDKSNKDKSNTDNSNTDKSNTDNSNTDKSNTNKSNTDNSNTDNSNTDKSNKSNKNKSNKNKSNNIIPYIIAFAILFILALIVLTWMLDRWYKNRTCDNNPYIWCSDNWICETSADENGTCGDNNGLNGCYKDATTIGLSSCLFGITSTSATICTTAGTSGTSGTTGITCPCAITKDNSTYDENCLIGCPISGQSLTSNPQCCCCPGTTGCHFKSVEEFCTKIDDVSQACITKLQSKDNIVCRVDCTV